MFVVSTGSGITVDAGTVIPRLSFGRETADNPRGTNVRPRDSLLGNNRIDKLNGDVPLSR